MNMDPADANLHERLDELASAGDARILAWIEAAAPDLRWSVHLVETIFDPQTVILASGAPQSLARRLFEAMQPLIPSIADRPGRTLPRLQLGIADPWAIALGAAAEPISRTFDPNFSAMLKAGSSGN
jgi:predicted NBD/HSP70 family sugar kinase